MSTKIDELARLGQSIWCDNLGRAMIDGGDLRRLMGNGVVGVTSNPTIFMKAITASADYDERLLNLPGDTRDAVAIYEQLVIPDIRDAADQFKPVYDRTSGVDGYVSLEVNPHLAFDTDGTIAEARRLFRTVDRPNLLIKVPATDEGIPAIRTLIGEGINVNVTLIFAISMYRRVIDAYIEGLRAWCAAGGDPSKVASVASFFVSRVDTAVDKRLAQANGRVEHLLGKAAIANATIAYQEFRRAFGQQDTFLEQAAHGARVQRPLWASTSTKNPSYPDTYYVDSLVGPHTVNTLPPPTIEAVLDHGRCANMLESDVPAAHAALSEIDTLGIDLEAVTSELTQAGVRLFAESFDELLDNLRDKSKRLRAVG